MPSPLKMQMALYAASMSALILVGCQTGYHSAADEAALTPRDHTLPSLVTVADDRVASELLVGREHGRNDRPEVTQPVPDRASTLFVEVQHREQLRTSSGRPREQSTTRTRTIRQHGYRR